ncbi:MAG: hypothetical protein A2X94_07050 [Bdellovibrionales bacterium GWB1_55_8]|nr:MAG: hypothetical protein A2X94_07050 [Bdellovibrionales bacterium GWB1_55_8]
MTSTSKPSINPLSAYVSEFLEARRLDRGAADRTIEAYRRDLTQFLAWLPAGLSLEQIEPPHLSEFLAQLTRDGNQPASVARKVSALRQFFKFCCLEKNLRTNPSEQLGAPSPAKRLPKALAPESITALLEAADRGLPYPRDPGEHLRSRDCAMVYLLYATGVRVSELVGLTLRDLELSEGYIRVQGKGDKQRVAPVAAIAGERLLEYLSHHRPALAQSSSSDHVFLNQRGFVITRQSFWSILRDFALAAGIREHLSPHTLRHSFATHLLQAGINLRSLQALLGHADLSTTQIYTQLTPAHLKAAHRKFHPRGE